MSKQINVIKFFDKCMYKDCKNTKSDGKRLFRFPLETDRRLEVWIHNSGNIKLEKWSSSSIRRAGLCEDHFDENSFTNNTKKRLNRNSVPIHYTMPITNENDEQINKNTEMQMEQMLHVEESNVKEIEFMEKNVILASSASIPTNNVITDDEQPLEQQRPLRCYEPPLLYFDASIEEENIIEWIHFESSEISENISIFTPEKVSISTPEKVSISAPEKVSISTPERVPPLHTYKNTTSRLHNKIKTKNEENNATTLNLYTQINSLRLENIRLRKQIKCLKYRLRHVPRLRKPPKSGKQKKKILQKMIDEQDLHPVAKAMIKLQLHTPNAEYTEEEKNLSGLLYYYSAAAFCRLKNEGCNFPGQRTVQKWLKENDIRSHIHDNLESNSNLQNEKLNVLQ